MAVLDGKTTMSNLQSKGFKLSNGHHKNLEFWHNGKMVLYTYCSHNGQDIDDYLISKMKRQCKLEKNDFIDLAKCPLSESEYVKKLVQAGYIEEDEVKKEEESEAPRAKKKPTRPYK